MKKTSSKIKEEAIERVAFSFSVKEGWFDGFTFENYKDCKVQGAKMSFEYNYGVVKATLATFYKERRNIRARNKE